MCGNVHDGRCCAFGGGRRFRASSCTESVHRRHRCYFRTFGNERTNWRLGKLVQLMDDVIGVVYSEPGFLMTALLNVLPILYLFGMILLVYLLVRQLRQRNEDEKRKNH